MKRAKTTMKAIITTVMACLSVFMIVESSYAKSKRGHIIILSQRPDAPGAPRTPVVNPFMAELMDGFNSVLLGSTDDVGTVAVQITSTAGDNYSTYFDTSDGTIFLPISGNTGYYSLTIVTSDGTQYVGEFIL